MAGPVFSSLWSRAVQNQGGQLGDWAPDLEPRTAPVSGAPVPPHQSGVRCNQRSSVPAFLPRTSQVRASSSQGV